MSTGGITKVVLLGAGNLSAHLGPALVRQRISVLQVYNRSMKPAKNLAGKIGAEWTDRLDHITHKADLYIIAVSDSAIPEIASMLRLKDRLVVHTSGSISMEILKPVSSHYGVLYPLQTFSLRHRTNFKTCPICIEANTRAGEDKLLKCTAVLSQNVQRINSDQRKVLHITAVFASNFTNFMYTIAEDILRSHGLPFSLLEPLIKQTAGNARDEHVFRNQTGPAIREDLRIIETHLEMLAKDDFYREIYDLISKNIIKYKKAHVKL